jgi:2-keto-4-pentenoate hydratase
MQVSVTKNESIQAAADLLYRHWRERSLLANLPDEIRPLTRADGYAIQARLEARTQRPLFGWKIAATSKAGQAHINVDGPLAGRLLAERVVPLGEAVALDANQMMVAEPEFAFRMGRDLPPQATERNIAEVMAAVAALHLAIEIPDSRFADFVSAGAPQLIADNACADQFILGPEAPALWRELDLVQHQVTGQVIGKIERQGAGANVLGDPRIALTWLANELSRLGVTLQAGEVVTTGTCMAPLAIAPGDEVIADFGILGRIGLRIAA